MGLNESACSSSTKSGPCEADPLGNAYRPFRCCPHLPKPQPLRYLASVLPMGIGYSVSCGYLIDNMACNLVYMVRSSGIQSNRLNSESQDILQALETRGANLISGSSKAYELHYYQLPFLNNSRAIIQSRLILSQTIGDQTNCGQPVV